MVAKRLDGVPLAAVYTSPQQRAWLTARPISERHGLDAIVDMGLEEIDFGHWPGRSFAELDADCDPAWKRWNEGRGSARAPGGESMVEAVARAHGALHALSLRHPNEIIAAVTHCDIIRGVIAHLLEIPLDNLLRFDIDPASLSRISLGDAGGRVLSVNERLIA
jgi:probable phosphoglycerate mutase